MQQQEEEEEWGEAGEEEERPRACIQLCRLLRKQGKKYCRTHCSLLSLLY